MSRSVQKGLAAAGVAALALGGSALAGAAQSGDPTKPGGHVGANGQVEKALPSDVAAGGPRGQGLQRDGRQHDAAPVGPVRDVTSRARARRGRGRVAS